MLAISQLNQHSDIMPERFSRIFTVDSTGMTESQSWPNQAVYVELADDEEALFVSGEVNVLNNFPDNLPGGRRRYERMELEELENYRKEYPEQYIEYLDFYKDIDQAIVEVGLSIETFLVFARQRSAIYSRCLPEDDLTTTDIEELTQIFIEIQKYAFPAYRLLRLKYGYKLQNLCS